MYGDALVTRLVVLNDLSELPDNQVIGARAVRELEIEDPDTLPLEEPSVI